MASAEDAILDLTLGRSPTLGAGRLICVDGPAGSGKTTLALAVADSAEGRGLACVVVHTDDLLRGWSGLSGLAESLDRLLRPLARGRSGHFRRWDWHASAWVETVPVDPVDLLVIEGVGSGTTRIADLVTALVWVEAPARVRLERGLARDGARMADDWRRWMTEEDELHARDRVAERADLSVDGLTGRVRQT